MEYLGYLASIIIGLSLGLIGGGGSILTVPVLVYLFNIEPVMATAYSLFIVGTTSLVGIWPKYKHDLINVKTAVIFGVPSIVAIYVTRAYIMPLIPAEILHLGNFILTKGIFLMLLFAILMIAASFSMIRKKKEYLESENQTIQKFNYPLIFLEGTVVGVLTGLVGAGGGFLIIPALVLLSKLPMKTAVGTSLLIIASKSLIGFTGDLQNTSMDWNLLLKVTAFAIIGIFIGNRLNKFVDGEKLKKAFGWFVLVMGVYIIFKELYI